MNKKFSTLVASLLLTSAFSVYAGTAASMFAAPVAIETKAVVGTDKALEWDDTKTNALPDEAAMAAAKVAILPGFTNNARLFVIANDGSSAITVATDKFVEIASGEVKVQAYTAGESGEAYWTMQSDGELLNNASHTFTVKGNGNFDVVPVKAKDKPGYFFVLRVKKSDGSFGGYVTYETALGVTTGTDAKTELKNAALFVSVETAFSTTAKKGEALNDELNGGFELSISSAKSGVKVTGADAFAGKLIAMKWNSTDSKFEPATSSDDSYFLQGKDGKYICWDANANKDSDKPGAFKLISVDDAKRIATDGGTNCTFAIYPAEDGSKSVQVVVDTTNPKRLYINNTNNEGRLTAFDKAGTVSSAANWAVTTLGSSNKVDLTQFMTGKFVKVAYVTSGEETAANKYKVGGTLAINKDNEDDFVKATTFLAEDPATHWAVTSADRGATITLTNREDLSVSLEISELRKTSKAGVYEVAATTADNVEVGDLITITAVSSTKKTDGYMVETENVLRNTTYYLAQSRQNADEDVPAYWAENHNQSHQIGATVNKDFATKWNLAFKKKTEVKDAYKAQIDSVLIVSTLNKWDASAKDVVETKDTLAILPYTFQNRENNEFVKKNVDTNLEYYICDEDNNEAVDDGSAQKFALKKKPGNTYNYVTLSDANTYADNGAIVLTSGESAFSLEGHKLFLGNSLERGSWEEMALYAKDNNSLMLVQPADDPEYHLVNGDKLAWGDTIKLFRDENNNQALYEKRDNKSIVANDTLSFLNIDNVYDPQFKMNPALFVDTAYVNRGENTCWQYLLAVNVDNSVKTWCPDDIKHNDPEWIKEHGVCPHAEKTPVVKGRFLVNLIDTANIYGATHLHKNPYVNQNEAGEYQAKLSFVPGMHIKDTLFLFTNDDTIKLDLSTPDFNIAKFAFRYEEAKDETFKIQTLWKEYAPEKAEDKLAKSQEGYLKWINGTVVVENGYNRGDLFGIEENFKGNPTANETIEAVSGIQVIAGEGQVTIAGAAGKKVVISNILGQVVANTVIASDNATIAAPAGVVVVAVEGEAAVKAIVK